MHVAIFAPVGRDADILATLLKLLHLQPLICTTCADFTAALNEEAWLAIATEEGLTRCSADKLVQQLQRQPLWSNLPILALADGNALLPGGAVTVIERLGNVTLITRPLRREALMLALVSAHSNRQLQYQVRDQLAQLSAHAAELEQRVDERTVELAREIRERRQVETSLLEARRLESLGRLTGGVAHDFNNLLQVIVGASHLVRMLGKDMPALNKPVDSILRAADQGARLTQQLLSFSRRQPMQLSDVRLDEHLLSMADLLRHSLGRDMTLKVEVAQTPWLVQTDLAQLEIAILNLVVNARDAMVAGGAVTLSIANLELPDNDFPELEALKGRFVQIALRDTGHGMSPAVARQAFEPFYTTKPLGKGTGLGLSQVYGYAHQSRGAAYLRSSPEGTTVCIVLPASAATDATGPTAASDEARVAPEALAGLKVLCVEDDIFVAEYATEMLASLGCRVCIAHDADQAMLSPLDQIDLVFSDVRMPGSIDGVEMAKQILARHPALPVILTSGFIGEPERLGNLPVQFVRKPYTPSVLAATLSAGLAR
ncbi:hypothetical protein ASF61_14860 [Duganella sp. Leaf126]|uniref:ATP-binding protein n=1 Tax=Duganella sp. Leaf126 TaxID=1736266 RepID=UPI0006FFA7FB|nr:ATP-binding protein [Duganella sp. Leaf126]KQQ32332.1 hypothetical protein ASF61_14860 [Duganella sp. Leaf126]